LVFVEEPISALDIAAAIIEEHPGLTQMQVHKLLYLVQAANLAWFGEPAFTQRIEAWQDGPVVRYVAGHYMEFEWSRIYEPVSGDSDELSPRTRWVVKRIVSDFGDLSGPELASLTKQETDSPWRQVRGDLPADAKSGDEIPLDVIEAFHRLHGVVPTAPSEEEAALVGRFVEGDEDALADLFESVTGKRPVVS
jgi:uncharacterized phage-associated protein